MDDDNMFQPKKEDEEATLPKATIAKIIKEILPNSMRCGNDARELAVEAGMEFLQMLSSQANDVCTKEGRQKMNDSHVLAALKDLKFEHYIKEVQVVNEEHKVEAEGRRKKSSKRKFKESGLDEAELLRLQEELFAKSRQVYQQRLTTPTTTPRASDAMTVSNSSVKETTGIGDELIAEGKDEVLAESDPPSSMAQKVTLTSATDEDAAPASKLTDTGKVLGSLMGAGSKLEGMEDEDDDYDAY